VKKKIYPADPERPRDPRQTHTLPHRRGASMLVHASTIGRKTWHARSDRLGQAPTGAQLSWPRRGSAGQSRLPQRVLLLTMPANELHTFQI